jgi:hypothetical protein
MLAPSKAHVSVVACHPHQPVVAAGYSDGTVLLVRLEDGALIQARETDQQPVAALGWNTKGSMLAFGTEAGAAGVLSL